MNINKCLEYYFDDTISEYEIEQRVNENINEIRKTTNNIKDIKLSIIRNKWGTYTVYATIILKKLKIKSSSNNKIKSKKQKITKMEKYTHKQYGNYKATKKYLPY